MLPQNLRTTLAFLHSWVMKRSCIWPRVFPPMSDNNGAADTEETRHPIGSNGRAAGPGTGDGATLSRGGDAGGGCLPTWNSNGGGTVDAVPFPPTLNSNGVEVGSADGDATSVGPAQASAHRQRLGLLLLALRDDAVRGTDRATLPKAASKLPG